MNKKEKTFDTMKWIREVRDKMYEDTKHLSTAERLQKISADVNNKEKNKEKSKS